MLRLIRDFIFAKKIWRWPRKSDVMIFDACNSDVLLEYTHRWNPEIFHVRHEKINIPVLLVSLFRGGNRGSAYVDCFIERVGPKLIVTTIDNNISFYEIHHRHPSVVTLFVQNGWRGYYADVFHEIDKLSAECRERLYVDHMLTFGDVTGGAYKKSVAGRATSIGSIKSNKIKTNTVLRKGTIGFVSQWQNEGIYMGGCFYPHEVFFNQVDSQILQCLSLYANKTNKQLFIVLRNPERDVMRSREERYFRELLGYQPQYFEQSEPYSSYHAIDAAEIVVSVDSTLGYEAIARGKKTAIFSIRGRMLGIPGRDFGWPGNFPQEGPFWTNHPDPAGFIRILDHLSEIDDEQWRQDLSSSHFSSLMTRNSDNSILRAILERELGEPKLMAKHNNM